MTHTSSYHCDGRLYVDPFICVDARVDKYQAVKVRLLTPTKCILNGVIVLDGTLQNNTSGCSQEHLEFEEEGEIIY